MATLWLGLKKNILMWKKHPKLKKMVFSFFNCVKLGTFDTFLAWWYNLTLLIYVPSFSNFLYFVFELWFFSNISRFWTFWLLGGIARGCNIVHHSLAWHTIIKYIKHKFPRTWNLDLVGTQKSCSHLFCKDNYKVPKSTKHIILYAFLFNVR